MKKIIVYIVVAVIFLVIIGTISFAIINNGKNDANINDKVSSEVKYLDREILEIMNSLNNIRIGININVEKQEEKTNSTDDKDSSSSSDNEESSSNSEEQSSSSGESDNEQKKNSNTNKIEYFVKDTPIVLVDKEQVNWDNLLQNAERLYSSWTTIVIDLNSLNVQNENIINFGTNLDNLIVNLKNNNKQQALICAANMYSLLPEYMNAAKEKNEDFYVLKITAGVLKAYATVEYDKGDTVNEGLTEADNAINALINSEIMLNNKNQSKIQETYVLLKELIKTANQKEKDVFILKYVTLMQKIDTYND